MDSCQDSSLYKAECLLRKGRKMNRDVEQYERFKRNDPSARLAQYQQAFEERVAQKEKRPVTASHEGRK